MRASFLRRPLPTSSIIALTMAVALRLAGCATSEPVAGLDELPREAAAKLASVPNRPLLATKIQLTDPAVSVPTPAAATCPQNWTITFFEAQVRIPVTVCSHSQESVLRENTVRRTGSPTTTFKLVDLGIVADLGDGVLWQPPLVCTTTNGPWSAQIRSDRGCIGTCRPVNNMVVIDAPNPIQFAWIGDPLQSQPGFEFVGIPAQTSKLDLGPCNTGGVPAQ